ncbi:hypothetical protein QJS10_CPB15g00114 [Acorus calamus]|uniref:Uncharacterized protein n=1 Tax=Acorus calamus TaxID=4465 RepID=A0AAV9D6W5_ACOCL|nr:hypothetical protein QJS10_CPB15g00114 [Acorus calamus]
MALQDKLGKTYKNQRDFTVKVKSIDGFQGSEEDEAFTAKMKAKVAVVDSPKKPSKSKNRSKQLDLDMKCESSKS